MCDGDEFDYMGSMLDEYVVDRFTTYADVFEFIAFCIDDLGVDPSKLYMEVDIAKIKCMIVEAGYLPVN